MFGRKDETILSSDLIGIWMTKGAYILGQEPKNLPTPTQWDLYIAEINNLLSNVLVSKEDCEKILEEIIEHRENIQSVVSDFEQSANKKIDEYNTNVENKKKELEEFSKTITVITSGKDDLIDGVSELPKGSIYIVF